MNVSQVKIQKEKSKQTLARLGKIARSRISSMTVLLTEK
jgi:hypothetical protein